MSRPAPSPRSAYARFEPLTLRWTDNDIYGHMNNAIHYQLFDTAVNGFLIRQGVLDIARGSSVFLVVSSSCDYFAELGFPHPVDAGLRVDRLGGSSVTYNVGLFQQNEAESAAQGHFTHVLVDRETRRPLPIPEDTRAVLQSLQMQP